MMLDVPNPLPEGMAAKVVSSIPPPNFFSMSASVRVPFGQAAVAGENPDRARAALARPNRLAGFR